MAKIKCFYRGSAEGTPQSIGSANTIEEAAKICMNKCSCNECYEAIINRGYYMISYGPSEVYIEEE